jgi:hypothetical protein
MALGPQPPREIAARAQGSALKPTKYPNACRQFRCRSKPRRAAVGRAPYPIRVIVGLPREVVEEDPMLCGVNYGVGRASHRVAEESGEAPAMLISVIRHVSEL